MATIFTRRAISDILAGEGDASEKLEQIMSLRGRDLESNYVSRLAADADKQEAVRAALEDAKKNTPAPNIEESDAYKALQAEYNGYKTKQEARLSDDFKGVKSKFFDAVYDCIDRSEGAKPVKDQLDELRQGFEEYFDAPAQGAPAQKPTFGGVTSGEMPKGDDAPSFAKAWGFGKK